MPLLPPNPLVIDSPLSVDEALERLRQATGRPRWAVTPSNTPARPFEGLVTGPEFRIRRAIAYKNSLVPRIRGNVEPRADGCRVTAALSPHPLMLLVMAVWFGAVLWTFIPALAGMIHGGDPGNLAFSGGMLLFGGGLALGAYGFEASAARDRLVSLLDARHPADAARRDDPAGGTRSGSR